MAKQAAHRCRRERRSASATLKTRPMRSRSQEEETISEVRGVLGRVIGDRYQDWFEFALAENSESDNDYYEIRNHEGKILIHRKQGVVTDDRIESLSEILLQCLCFQQTRNVEMPAEIVPVEEPIRKETPYQIRMRIITARIPIRWHSGARRSGRMSWTGWPSWLQCHPGHHWPGRSVAPVNG